MKKLLFLLILSGCGYSSVDSYSKVVVISRIEQVTSYCWYYGEGTNSGIVTLTSSQFRFTDTCGKFQIGDTVKLTK